MTPPALVPTTIVPTSCPLDCPDACSLEAHVEAGRVVRLEASTDRNPLTQGFLCAKVRRFPERVHGATRVLHPMRRVGTKAAAARFERVSWDDALDLMAERIRSAVAAHGGEAVLPYSYGGSNGLLTQDTLDARFFSRLGASRLLRTVCAAATGRAATGLYGKMPGVAFEDYQQAQLVVLWGANPSASNTHLVPLLHQARENGTRLAVVDPRPIPLAKQADLHLAIRPGSDVAVALSIARWFFETGRADLAFLAEHATGGEEFARRAAPWTFARAAATAGVEPIEIERLAVEYAAANPAVIRCGWGLERNRNGGSAVASVLALPAIAGKFGVRGGGYTLSNSGAWSFPAGTGEPPATTRALNMNRLGRDLLELDDPPIQVLFVYNSNVLATSPRQERIRRGLERSDLFTVVHEQTWTDTALLADLVLPATTFLEHHDLVRGYGAYALQDVRPVIEPVAEAWPNERLFVALERRLGLDRPEDESGPAELRSRRLSGDRFADARERLEDPRGWAAPPIGTAPIQFVDSFPLTPDRKAHLVPPDLDAEAPDGLYAYRELDGPTFDVDARRYPLTLLSPATRHTISSTLGELWREAVPLEMSSEDAASRGLATGDTVRVYDGDGEVICGLRVEPGLRAGVVVLPKGLWSHHTQNGRTANVFAPDHYADLGGAATFNDARVEVERAAPRST